MLLKITTNCNVQDPPFSQATHGKLLSLVGRLFSGLSMEMLRTSTATMSSSDTAGISDASYLSAAISHDDRLHKIASDIIDHCLKLLSILCHIQDETPVVIPPPKTANLPTAANSTLSPLKKRQSQVPGAGADPTFNSLSRYLTNLNVQLLSEMKR